jgi:tetratricopeptide (TPR) repeat protein
MAPKNGIPYIMYGADFADADQPAKALQYVEKGYKMLSGHYKKDYASTYGGVLHRADKKAEAYKFLEDEIASGNNSEEVIREYFRCYLIDKRYEDGIAKATEFIEKDPQAIYYRRRGTFYNEMGNSEKACEDAVTLRDKYDAGDFWQKEFNCPDVMAPVKPSMDRTYIYEVVFQGNTYDFRVTNPKVNMDEGISFKYKLTVNISKDAINTAHAQMNHFGKANYDLTDRTTVWVSNEVFAEIKNKGETLINGDVYFGQGEVIFTNVTDENNIDELYYKVKVDDTDKYIKAIKILGKDGEEMWINDDPKNPLILKMKTDFTIELKQIL